jgi:hypothetical protein
MLRTREPLCGRVLMLDELCRPREPPALLFATDKFGKLKPDVIPHYESISDPGHYAYVAILRDYESDAAGNIGAVSHHRTMTSSVEPIIDFLKA